MSKGNESPHYADTSFLDDINIDEIVGYLTKCDEIENENKTDNTLKDNNLETAIKELASHITQEDGINSSLSECVDRTRAIASCCKIEDNIQNYHTRTKININLIPTSNQSIIKNKEFKGSFTIIQPFKGSKPFESIKESLQKAEHIETNCKRPCLKSIAFSKENMQTPSILEKYLSVYLKKKCCILSTIHYGKFSEILKCKDSDGKEYALKMLCVKYFKYLRGAHIEKILEDIQCDIPIENLFCVYLYTSFIIDGHRCFLMDFYPKTLREEMLNSNKPLSVYMMQDLARQLVSAVTLLRNNNVVHSDIKPHHILLNYSNNKLKLCGFDKAYYIDSAIVSPNLGTLSYRAPEVILGYSAGFSIDVWSTALVLHEMVTWRKLFTGWSNYDILYSQMETLGNIPPKMINKSCYGNSFKKIFHLNNKKSKLRQCFVKSDKIRRTVLGAYFEHWAPSRTKSEKGQDKTKINSFIKLLRKMIVFCPERRLSIEFVYANPFIYEVFDH